MTTGIIIDSQVKLRRVMTHLDGMPHKEAEMTKKQRIMEKWI